ncbi:MAG: PH domain-containing protein [Candidatus Nanopelagicales bacterium]
MTPRRTNPLSPLVQAAPAIPAAILFLLGPGAGMVSRGDSRAIALVIATAIVGYAVFVGLSWLVWWRRTFWIDADGDLRMDSGLIHRSARRLQLSRLQSVDIVAPFLARLVGLVEVRVEVAGAGDSRIVLRYLKRDEADALRHQVLATARRVDPAPSPDQPDRGGLADPPGPIDVEVGAPLALVPAGRLLGSLLLRSVTAALLVATAALLAMTILTQGPAGLILVLITGGLPILSVVTEFLANYGFRVDRTTQGLRIRRGLLSTQTRTIPAKRVHAIAVISPLLWRRWNWVRVSVTIAGVESDQVRPYVPIPVAPRDEALRLIAEVLPGVDVESLPFEQAPARARWRAPWSWSYLACAITPQVIACRSGRITRRITIALHARVQSVRLTEGPWERSLGLASLHADTAPGPVRVAARHLSLDQVDALARHEVGLMLRARQS